MKAALHNLGCKVNAYETEAMQQLLEQAEGGYTLPLVHITDYPSLPVRAIAQTFSWYAGYGRFGFDSQLWGYDEWELRNTCFDGLDGKRIYMYGAGAVADKFLAFYHREIQVDCIFDDNAYIWNSCKRGVRIDDPNLLLAMNPDEYKVIISARDFRPIYEHLRTIGVKNIGLYDADYIYPGRQTLQIVHDEKKNYRIGYLAGVFDLVHYGHLRMFQRAKEQCDYLVVGVVMDEGVRLGKNKEPYIPFDERIQMVQAMEYVDEAVEIPYDYPGTVEAFQKYHFDVQFSGSDYVDNPEWLAEKELHIIPCQNRP